MIKINNFSIEFWSDTETWFICYPDGSAETIFGVSLRYVMYRVLYLINKDISSIFDSLGLKPLSKFDFYDENLENLVNINSI